MTPTAAGAPTVFFVIGPAGSGKSTVSRRIAEQFGTAYLDKDTLATRFTETLLQLKGFDKDERDHNEFYRSTILPLEYETLLAVCGDNLARGVSVVLDAPFGKFFDDDDYLVQARARHGWPDAELIVVHVRTDGDQVLERLLQRDYHRDGWKVRHWQQFWSDAQRADCRWRGAHHLTFDNNTPEIDTSGLARQVASVRGAGL